MKKNLLTMVAAFVAVMTQAQTIAVMEFESNSFNLESRTATMSDLLMDELVNNDDLVVLERSRINAVLKEMDFQQTTGYTDDATAKSVGKMLNADCVIVGNVNMTGLKMTATARAIDVETARILSTAKMTCASWSEFDKKLPSFAKDLVKKIPVPNYFVGTWQGSSNETSDTYEIALDEKNKCSVTLVTSDELGGTIELSGTGSYSYDSSTNMFRLDARLTADLGTVKKISWRNFAKLDKSRTSFNYLIKDGKNQYRLNFAKTE
ncbi:MAG: hypothetical protein IJT42_07500 [Treponema sp.]|nr:hypothetical protein [Treponema sp.]